MTDHSAPRAGNCNSFLGTSARSAPKISPLYGPIYVRNIREGDFSHTCSYDSEVKIASEESQIWRIVQICHKNLVWLVLLF